MWRNSGSGYGVVHITLHWVLALAIISLFALGLYMRELDYYDPGYHSLPGWHKGIGLLVAALMLFRLYWRYSNPKPDAIGNGWQQSLAQLIHGLFYWLIVALAVSGYLISTADNRPLDLFGIISLPAVATFDEQRVDQLGELHEWAAWLTILLACAHAAAALFHHFVLKDQTLTRILRTTRREH